MTYHKLVQMNVDVQLGRSAIDVRNCENSISRWSDALKYYQQIKSNELVLQRSSGVVVINALIDSMEGTKLVAVKLGLCALVASLNESDFVNITAFSHHSKSITEGFENVINLATKLPGLLMELRENGSTACYDATIRGVAELRQFTHTSEPQINEGYKNVVIVLTDGEDTSSERTAEMVKYRLSNPGINSFMFILVAVDMNQKEELAYQSWMELRHCKQISVNIRSGSKLVQVFREVLISRVLHTDLNNNRFFHESLQGAHDYNDEPEAIQSNFVQAQGTVQSLRQNLLRHLPGNSSIDESYAENGSNVSRAVSRCNSECGDFDDYINSNVTDNNTVIDDSESVQSNLNNDSSRNEGDNERPDTRTGYTYGNSASQLPASTTTNALDNARSHSFSVGSSGSSRLGNSRTNSFNLSNPKNLAPLLTTHYVHSVHNRNHPHRMSDGSSLNIETMSNYSTHSNSSVHSHSSSTYTRSIVVDEIDNFGQLFRRSSESVQRVHSDRPRSNSNSGHSPVTIDINPALDPSIVAVPAMEFDNSISMTPTHSISAATATAASLAPRSYAHLSRSLSPSIANASHPNHSSAGNNSSLRRDRSLSSPKGYSSNVYYQFLNYFAKDANAKLYATMDDLSLNKKRMHPECYCPITHMLMVDPVVCADGHTYERGAIETWLKTHNTSPVTNLPLPHLELVPNHSLRSLIETLFRAQLQPPVKVRGKTDGDEPEKACDGK